MWGSFILHDAERLQHIVDCKAKEFYWSQACAFIAVFLLPFLQCVEHGCGCSGKCTFLLQLVWNIAFAVFSIYLWLSLGDEWHNQTCTAMFQSKKKYDEFLILWKITATLYYTGVAMLLLVLCLLCRLKRKLEEQGSDQSVLQLLLSEHQS